MASTFAPDRSQTATATAHHAQYRPQHGRRRHPIRWRHAGTATGFIATARPLAARQADPAAATRPERSSHRYRRLPAKNPQLPPAGNENMMLRIMAPHDGDGSSKRAR
ncbi:hypothetical protein [Vogesella indigofera]|uniref:hypothetical protein n=1 Tax=Vogesella indigofera TaxID=45465 RepID=UPI00234DA3A9|nr:hypothetical protein [Vogesella indigofera]MDC7705144.1 hypothetical protein [Vogesella indigofera]